MGYPIYHSQYTAAQIEASIGKTPRIKAATRTWEIWDISTSAYVDTGVSIDTELFVDSTLTEAGYAADAKVTGDKIGELKSALDADEELLIAESESVNIWNPVGVGYYNRYGTYYSSESYRHMGLPVSEGDVFRVYEWATESGITKYYESATLRLCAYNNGTAISTIDVSSAQTYTVPSGVTDLDIAINVAINTDPLVTLNDSAVPDTHQDYYPPFKTVKTDKTLTQPNEIADAKETGDAISGLDERVSAIESSEKPFEIVMPKVVPIAAGLQMNLYNDNYILGDIGSDKFIDYSINNLATVSKALTHNIQINPAEATVQPGRIDIKDKRTKTVIEQKTFTISVVPNIATAKKAIFIGDSLTDIGYYPAEIEHNLSDGMIASVGTRSRTVEIGGESLTSANEGRGGWSPTDYVTKASVGAVVNAFWNANTSKFDFSNYVAVNGYSGIDFVCITLGTNGVANTEANVSAIQEMIASIHNYDSNIKIIVSLITPGATQDGWGNLNHTASGDTFKANQLTLNKAYMNAFEDKITNVYVAPLYLDIDTRNDFPTEQYPLSSRNQTMVSQQSNNVHPALPGYLKMADVLYSTICYVASLN